MSNQPDEFAKELINSYTPHKPEDATIIHAIHQSLKYIITKLNQFNPPLTYDGSETIKFSLQKVINVLNSDVTKTYFGETPAHVKDAQNRLIEAVYFHYKYAQRNMMKINMQQMIRNGIALFFFHNSGIII